MTTPKLFGTDGIRGTPGQEPLTPGSIRKIAAGYANLIKKIAHGKKNPSVVLGKDTRASCAMIEQALAAGLTDVGVDVEFLGVLPTAAVAYLTKHLKADGGIMISASHNPSDENGIKFFTQAGEKLSEKEEEFVENNIGKRAERSRKGTVKSFAKAEAEYFAFLVESAGRPKLAGLNVVVDAANGSAYKVAGVFASLGAAATLINNKPDGNNINEDCGALHPQQLQREAVSMKAACGIAFDGDADRVVMVDEKGKVVDGDGLILALAKEMLQQGKLNKQTVVVTEYTNTAFDDELALVGVKTVRVQNGDKYVYAEMRKHGYSLGGEQSGHIIIGNNTTGDGILAAIHILTLLKESGLPFSKLTEFTKKPQALINVEVKEKKELSTLPLTSAAIAAAEKRLQQLKGRSLIRYSGTQNVLRIMLECNDREEIKKLAEEITAAAKKEVGV
ncbi:phosphoglucosamine mutase [Candidatus Woesearchaeota archaeon]|nr:phosphoglucosamine mutase [Candidatus Woesearchaeota archaeon]